MKHNLTIRSVRENGTLRIQTYTNKPSRTQQQFADQCDINNIIKKYKQTGELTHTARKQGVYADVSQISDYYTSLNEINSAKEAFGTLSSQIRLRFNNDPGQLLAFMQDPNNFEEGVKLGIYEPKQQFSEEKINQTQTQTKTKTKTSQNTQTPNTPLNPSGPDES